LPPSPRDLYRRPDPGKPHAAAPRNPWRNRGMRRLNGKLCALVLALAAVGCGHSESEWQAQLDKYGQLENQYNDEKSQREQLEEELAATKLRVAELSARLKEMGVNLDQITSELEQGTTEK